MWDISLTAVSGEREITETKRDISFDWWKRKQDFFIFSF